MDILHSPRKATLWVLPSTWDTWTNTAWYVNLDSTALLSGTARKVRGTYTVEKSHRWRYHRAHAAKLRAIVTAPSIGRIKQKKAKLQPPPSARVVSHTSVDGYLMVLQHRVELRGTIARLESDGLSNDHSKVAGRFVFGKWRKCR